MTSLGLSPRAGAALAYSGWWVTGIVIWYLERRDPVVRFHAAQSMVVFGTAAALVVLFGALAVVSLSYVPSVFGALVAAAMATWAAAVVLWGWTMWKVASGAEWRIPVAARLIQRIL